MSCPVYFTGGAGKVNIFHKEKLAEQQALSPGVFYQCLEIDKSIPEPIFVFEVDLSKAKFKLVADETAPEDYVANYSPLLMVNGGYFERDCSPSGLVIEEGVILNDPDPKLSGVLIIRQNKASLEFMSKVPLDSLKTVDYALQSGPFIIKPGRKKGIRADSGKAARTAVGVTKEGRLILISSPRPVSLLRLQNIVLASLENVASLLNLDGGTSTMLKVNCPQCVPPISIKYTPHPKTICYPNALIITP